MPASAYALLALFSFLSVAAGWVSAWLIGPRRLWAAAIPSLAAFGALWLVGHRFVVRVGPTVELFGWQVSLPFDVAVALGSALGAAGLQRVVLRLLHPEKRGARGNGLA